MFIATSPAVYVVILWMIVVMPCFIVRWLGKFGVPLVEKASSSFYDLLFQIIQSKEEEEVLEFCLLAWNIWVERNKAIHEHHNLAISCIVTVCSSMKSANMSLQNSPIRTAVQLA